jgi:hypothetical protein
VVVAKSLSAGVAAVDDTLQRREKRLPRRKNRHRGLLAWRCRRVPADDEDAAAQSEALVGVVGDRGIKCGGLSAKWLLVEGDQGRLPRIDK